MKDAGYEMQDAGCRHTDGITAYGLMRHPLSANPHASCLHPVSRISDHASDLAFPTRPRACRMAWAKSSRRKGFWIQGTSTRAPSPRASPRG